ncbi:MAG: hypothetical protein M3Y65_13280, partial [Pseudomonadota bacterium]|nr:hypothetical protein [Pseudomonadota bacterium]
PVRRRQTVPGAGSARAPCHHRLLARNLIAVCVRSWLAVSCLGGAVVAAINGHGTHAFWMASAAISPMVSLAVVRWRWQCC